MLKRHGRKLWLLALGLLLLLATGCQAVGGIDVGKAMLKSLEVTSYEGNARFSLELAVSPSAELDAEAKQVLDAFKNISVTLNEIKQQDFRTASMAGVFSFGKGDIPFELSLAGEKLVLDVEGGKKPIVLDMTATGTGESIPQTFLPNELMYQKFQDIAKLLYQFILDKADNPQGIGVERVTETINGETLQLAKVHVAMDGKQLQAWLKDFITSVLEDKEGLKEVVGQLYDLLAPLVAEAAKESGQSDPFAGMMSNREMAVTFITSIVENALTSAVVELDGDPAKGKEQGEGPIGEIVKSLAMDLYLDSDLNTRKSSFELTLGTPMAKEEGLQEIKLAVVQEIWNINGNVQADLISDDGGFVVNETVKGKDFLNNFQEDSLVYKLLKEDLRIDRQVVVLTVIEDESQQDRSNPLPYISKNGNTLVPVRYVVEELGADVKWDQEKQQVTVTDPETQTTIVLTIGSDKALVNGREKTLQSPAELTYGTTFVPVRFIAEEMGATVEWDGELRMVTITREP